MKKRKTLLILSAVLVVLLVAGGTMAWFTATAPEVVNSFTAGTLKIELKDQMYEDGSEELVDFKAMTNINPGDTKSKVVSVDNVGTKRAFIRVSLTPNFVGVNQPDYSLVTYPEINGWIRHTDGWYYYPQEVAAGASTANLIEQVIFNGADMGNEYQGKEFTLTVKAEAIQVTNGAAANSWGVDPLSLVPPVPVTP